MVPERIRNLRRVQFVAIRRMGVGTLAGWMSSTRTPWRLPPAHSPLDREIARLAIPAFGALIAEPLYVSNVTVGRSS